MKDGEDILNDVLGHPSGQECLLLVDTRECVQCEQGNKNMFDIGMCAKCNPTAL